ncbi:MAG: coiled-coil domain-containing protein [Candidatus Hodarchaeota archaeon]
MKGIVILNLNKKSELSIDTEYPENICEELGVTNSMLETVFDEHKKIRTGPNYLEMQIKRDLSIASFFTGHSSKHFIGKGDHVLTVFLSDEDILPRNFEGQVRRIAFELLPKNKEKKFKELFTKSYELLEKGELDAYWQERQELEQEIGEKKEKIDDLAQKVSLLVSDRSEHLRNVEALKSEVSELYSKLENWSVQMAELNEYNATLTAKNRELTRLTNVQKLALGQKDERINNLKAKLSDTDEIEKGAEKILAEIRKIKLENDRLIQEIEKLNETNKKLKFQVLKAKRESESVPNLELEIKKLKDKILGVTNEKENIRRTLMDLKNDIKIIREERDRYYKIVKGNKLL